MLNRCGKECLLLVVNTKRVGYIWKGTNIVDT